MPLFKFSKVVNAGHILVSTSIDGEIFAPSAGDIILDNAVFILGQHESVKGTGDIAVVALLSGQAFAPAEGGISLSVVLEGYSAGAAQYIGTGNLLFYPYPFVVLSGDAVLNGVAAGNVLVKKFVLLGHEAVHGDILVRKPVLRGFGAHRVCAGNIFCHGVLTGNGESTYTVPRTGTGNVRQQVVNVDGRGSLEVLFDRKCDGDIVAGVVTVFGLEHHFTAETTDVIIRYESRRRLI